MNNQLPIHTLRNLPHHPHHQENHLARLQRRKRPQQRPRIPTPQQHLPHPHQLRDHTEDIQMGTVRQQEIPQGEHFGERRRARAHGQHGGEGVDLGFDAGGE